MTTLDRPSRPHSERKGSLPRQQAMAAAHPRPTPLQQHILFFDRDHDGKIGPRETYAACRAMGCGRGVAMAATVLINGTMGWPSARSWWPTLTIHIDGIERAMHGSDTRVYDETGAFDESRFERTFARYDSDGDGAWSVKEFVRRVWAQRNVFDLFGQTATVLEFGLLYYLVGKQGKVDRESLRKVYDGSLFYELAGEPLPAAWGAPAGGAGKPPKGVKAAID